MSKVIRYVPVVSCPSGTSSLTAVGVGGRLLQAREGIAVLALEGDGDPLSRAAAVNVEDVGGDGLHALLSAVIPAPASRAEAR